MNRLIWGRNLTIIFGILSMIIFLIKLPSFDNISFSLAILFMMIGIGLHSENKHTQKK